MQTVISHNVSTICDTLKFRNQRHDINLFPEIGEMGGILPGLQEILDDRPDIDLGGPTMLMEPSIHAPANALPASVELYDSGNAVDEYKMSSHDNMFAGKGQRKIEQEGKIWMKSFQGSEEF
uniref:Uncharacterized protein n=1 Tax=Solanum lycopersicum TaxID=4081 RepID=A0A3Q7HK18_SOLLC